MKGPKQSGPKQSGPKQSFITFLLTRNQLTGMFFDDETGLYVSHTIPITNDFWIRPEPEPKK